VARRERVAQVEGRALYATYSSISRVATKEREALLDGLEAIADEQFCGIVERAMVTSLLSGRRPL
jgi:hypothetical protein